MGRVYISPATRKLVFERANRYCEYCKCPSDFSTEPFSIEHIIPKSKNGTDDFDNLALACIGCNVYKSDKINFIDTITQELFPLYNPRINNWDDHFIWDEAFTGIVGKTAIGRVSITAIRLNRRQLKNLRRALIAIGEHPPN
jgi:5-methylcytosine-specific restriction endonuclease McrA